MAIKVLLIVSSVQLLSVLGVVTADEFSKLFGSDRRKPQILDENGMDTGIQYNFIPHVESESVPESATYTFSHGPLAKQGDVGMVPLFMENMEKSHL